MYRKKLIEKFRFFFKKSSMSFKQPIYLESRGGTTLLHDLLYLSDDLESLQLEKKIQKEFGGHLHYGENVPKSLLYKPSLSRFLDCG